MENLYFKGMEVSEKWSKEAKESAQNLIDQFERLDRAASKTDYKGTDLEVYEYIRNGHVNYAALVNKNASEAEGGSSIETRTRNANLNEALSLKIHDPLWMLTRQWQYGEFRGNDAGSAIVVRADLSARNLDTISFGGRTVNFNQGPDCAMEPLVERVNEDLSPRVAVESAMHFKTLLKKRLKAADVTARMQELRLAYPLADKETPASVETDEVREFTRLQNTALRKFNNAFGNVAFDGCALYEGLSQKNCPVSLDAALGKEYTAWFEKTYLPNKSEDQSAWRTPKLGYEFSARSGKDDFVAEDYHSGRVSWYAFDHADAKGKAQNPHGVRDYHFTGMPVLATFPGAPNKRLWQFEDKKVYLGNSNTMLEQSSANALMMQYATMYGNDWMLIPLDVTIGSYVTVKDILVIDTFGRESHVRERAGSDSRAATFGQRWEMFTNAPLNIEQEPESKETSAPGLFFPPSLQFTLEGPVEEEVQFLRDEMANMVWGVENKIPDGCGSTIDCGMLAARVSDYIDSVNESVKPEEKGTLTIAEDGGMTKVTREGLKADYKYVLQNTVPLNWIPFLPQRIKDDEYKREIALRRAKMPVYVAAHDDYLPARPLSSLLRVEPGEGSVKEKPLYINEEEIVAVGTKVVKNHQRTRWLNGKTFTWTGISKQISKMQGDSGLMFDELIEK